MKDIKTWNELLRQVEAAIKRERVIDPILMFSLGFGAGWLFAMFTILAR